MENQLLQRQAFKQAQTKQPKAVCECVAALALEDVARESVCSDVEALLYHVAVYARPHVLKRAVQKLTMPSASKAAAQ